MKPYDYYYYNNIKKRAEAHKITRDLAPKGAVQKHINVGLNGRTYKNMATVSSIRIAQIKRVINQSPTTEYCSKCNCIVSRNARKRQKGVRKTKLLCAYCYMTEVSL